jgi:GNAT superfamily N-acetyltransferase
LERNSFTAYIDGVPVGGAFMSVFDTATGALVVDVLVHRNYRDARVGPRIIREVESHARKLGAQRIRSILTQDNRHALSYFESCGYSKVIMLEKDIKEAA